MDLESVKIKVILDGKEAQMGLSKFDKLIGSMGKNTKVVDKSFKNLGKTLSKAGLIGKALGIGTIAFTMKSFAESAHRAAEEIRQLSYVSERTGVSVQRLSKTGTALESLGIKAGTYQEAVDLLSSAVPRLYMGDAGLASALAAMGINPIKNGKQVSGEDLFAGAANYAKRQAMRGEIAKNAARRQLMEMGFKPEIIEKMWGGAEEFFRNIEEQSKKVGSLSEKEIEKAENSKKWIDELSTAFDITTKKLSILATDGLEPFGRILTKIVKGVGDVTTAVGENDGLGTIAKGTGAFLIGTKLLPGINTGVHRVLSPLIESNSILGGAARGAGAVTETATGIASKALAGYNLYKGAEMTMEGMFDFWKGNDKASKAIYDNISAPIGDAFIKVREFVFDTFEEYSAEEFNKAGGMDALIDNARKGFYADLPPMVGENWDRSGSNDIKIDIKQEFNGMAEPESVKDATQNALDLSLKGVNLI